MFKTQKTMFADICVKTNQSLHKNALVTCNKDHCYISYSQFVKRHPKYAIRFAYKCFPIEDTIYRVLGVYPHVMDDFWDDNDYVVVVESTKNRQIFLMGEQGLIVVPDKVKELKNKIKQGSAQRK